MFAVMAQRALALYPVPQLERWHMQPMRWQFERSGHQSWYWEKQKLGAERMSLRVGPFPSFTSCLVDAQQKGFNPGRAERRKLPRTVTTAMPEARRLLSDAVMRMKRS